MTKKIFLTSFIALGFAMPSMAAPSNTGTFPTDGKMQADYTYTNAATSDNMAGVYENSVYANAQYTTNDYTVSAGTYLPADAEATATCTAGSFCPGLQSPVQYNETTAQGITACPTGYTNSVAGATSNTQCYRTCASNDVPHSTGALNGGVYYNGTSGDGTNACEPTACENGYHVNAGNPDLNGAIGTEAGTGLTSNDNNGDDYNTDGMSNSIISDDPMAFAVDYGNKGIIKGHGRCSKRGVANQWYDNDDTFESDHFVDDLTNETGRGGALYCYCNITGYTPNGGTLQNVSAPWVFRLRSGNEGYCAEACASNCAISLRGNTAFHLAFRAAVFGSLGTPGPAGCEANTITINWSDADQTDIDANNAGTVTYGGNINTPVKAQTKKGKTFTGWVFSTTAPGEQ